MAKRVPKFTYNGTYKTDADDEYWYIYLLSSGTLSFKKDKSSYDVFAVAGGAGGNGGTDIFGGAGGASGRTLTLKNLSAAADQAYEIVVGLGGSGGAAHGFASPGGATIAFGATVAGGTVDTSGFTSQPGGSIGGSGGGTGAYKNLSWTAGKGGADGANGSSGSGSWAAGSGQGTTTRAFGDTDGVLYASGGGGGGFTGVASGAAGGDDTAGTGGTNGAGGDAQPNTGSGGGGGYGASTAYAGGAGADGVVIIRGMEEDALPVFFNGTELAEIVFDGVAVETIVYNGTTLS